MSQETQISMPIAKASAATAAAIGAQIVDAGHQATSIFAELFTFTWPNLAAFAAFVYTASMLTEFYWKKTWRPLFERWKWMKPKPRRVYTAREIELILAARDTGQSPLES